MNGHFIIKINNFNRALKYRITTFYRFINNKMDNEDCKARIYNYEVKLKKPTSRGIYILIPEITTLHSVYFTGLYVMFAKFRKPLTILDNYC